MPDDFKHGQWAVACDRCGFKYKSKSIKLEWTGLRVCDGPATNNCWEPRHPQEFVRGRKDKQTPPWTRPEQPDVFVTPGPPNWDDL